MTEKSILLYQHEVRGVLQGRQRRITRIVKNASDIIQDWDKHDKNYGPFFQDEFGETHKTVEAAPYPVGMRLWVRETFEVSYGGGVSDDNGCLESYLINYKTSGNKEYRFLNKKPIEGTPNNIDYKILDQLADTGKCRGWRPSIHMPRWASRLTLEVTGVRVERVRDITEEDALAEGVQPDGDMRWNPVQAYKALWSSIHGPSLWAENPFCWVYNIKLVEER